MRTSSLASCRISSRSLANSALEGSVVCISVRWRSISAVSGWMRTTLTAGTRKAMMARRMRMGAKSLGFRVGRTSASLRKVKHEVVLAAMAGGNWRVVIWSKPQGIVGRMDQGLKPEGDV
uniref:Uncharacterized protein n=1 Tax=Triticum urartu TaxID=4572 RepID=A0A8R7VB44_TRIUA